MYGERALMLIAACALSQCGQGGGAQSCGKGHLRGIADHLSARCARRTVGIGALCKPKCRWRRRCTAKGARRKHQYVAGFAMVRRSAKAVHPMSKCCSSTGLKVDTGTCVWRRANDMRDVIGGREIVADIKAAVLRSKKAGATEASARKRHHLFKPAEHRENVKRLRRVERRCERMRGDLKQTQRRERARKRCKKRTNKHRRSINAHLHMAVVIDMEVCSAHFSTKCRSEACGKQPTSGLMQLSVAGERKCLAALVAAQWALAAAHCLVRRDTCGGRLVRPPAVTATYHRRNGQSGTAAVARLIVHAHYDLSNGGSGRNDLALLRFVEPIEDTVPACLPPPSGPTAGGRVRVLRGLGGAGGQSAVIAPRSACATAASQRCPADLDAGTQLCARHHYAASRNTAESGLLQRRHEGRSALAGISTRNSVCGRNATLFTGVAAHAQWIAMHIGA